MTKSQSGFGTYLCFSAQACAPCREVASFEVKEQKTKGKVIIYMRKRAETSESKV